MHGRRLLTVLLLLISAGAIVTAVLRLQPRPLGIRPDAPRRVMPEPGELWLPNQTGSLKFAVMGDVGRGDQRQYETADQMAIWRKHFEFEFVLMLGDNIYGNSGAPAEYERRFERPYRALLQHRVEFHAALGNHDPPGQEHYEPFGMGGSRYYTFSKWAGPPWSPRQVQFFALDTVNLDRDEQRWIQQQLSASDAPWKIAFYHHPLYSSGDYRWRSYLTRRVLEPVFRSGGLDVGFSGHEHLYERIVPRYGVQYFSSGAGGAIRVGSLHPSSLTAAGFDGDTHFILVEINGDTLWFQTITRAGRTVDYGEVENRRE